MPTVNVQFTDATEATVKAVFAVPQDPAIYPNQAAVPDTDARYLAFIDPASTAAGKVAAAALAAIAGGLAITSTSTPAVNGTYAADQAAQLRINAIETAILKNGAFPGPNGTQIAYPDAAGAMHVFPSPALFSEFATAMANFVADVDLYAAGAPGAALPPSTVTIA